MNLTKSIEYFDPVNVKGKCHIIGCGSVGSTVAEVLVRCGVTNIALYDFDTVSEHNLANQMFFARDVKRLKVEALRDMLCDINPDLKATITIHPDGWTETTRLSGYVFMCVDNIDLRREIVTKNKMNRTIKALFDFRTTLETMQCYAANWGDAKMIADLLKTMDFSHEEAKSSTPRTACGVELGVAPTVRIGSTYGVSNFINYINGKPIKKLILVDAFGFDVEAY